MLRELAYVFTYRAESKLSIITKLYTPITLMLFLSLGINSSNTQSALLQLTSILILELSILIYIGSLKRVLTATAFVAMFIGIGFALRIASQILGYEPTAIGDMVISTLRVVEFFLAITIAFQWVRVSEYGWIIRRIGLKNVATLLVIVLTQIPPILIAYSEALTTIKLKYGGKMLQRAIKPLVIYSFNYGRDVAEAIYMYGVSEPKIKIDVGRRDLVIILGLTIILVGLGLLPRTV